MLDKISEAALCGIEFIQLREKDLSGRDLEFIAREAMQRVRSIRPDLIVTDLVMPVMDGMELIKSLRAEETLNRIPVIAIARIRAPRPSQR